MFTSKCRIQKQKYGGGKEKHAGKLSDLEEWQLAREFNQEKKKKEEENRKRKWKT